MCAAVVSYARMATQGVYVLTDNRFRWLSRLTGAAAGPATDAVVARTLYFPCGLIRGALAALGVPAVVTAEPGTLPACALRRGGDAVPLPDATLLALRFFHTAYEDTRSTPSCSISRGF